MPNPFSGIITSDMKTIFNNAIDALLEDSACMVPCTVYYGDTNNTDCPNCSFNVVTGRSSGLWTSGGPIEFHGGTCPYCHGRGVIPNIQTETIYLMPIWDYRDWVNWSGTIEGSRYPEGFVQTMSKMADTITQIKKAKEIIIDTEVEKYVHHRFTRYGEPNPCGFGDDRYIFTIWKRIG